MNKWCIYNKTTDMVTEGFKSYEEAEAAAAEMQRNTAAPLAMYIFPKGKSYIDGWLFEFDDYELDHPSEDYGDIRPTTCDLCEYNHTYEGCPCTTDGYCPNK